MSFLNGLRKAHLLRRKPLGAANSRITQPLMEETQRTSITMQPTEQNVIDCCLMETTTNVTDDRDGIQQIGEASTTTTNITTTASTSNNSTATTTTTLIPAYENMPQHTTTALLTITAASPMNSTITPATAAVAIPFTSSITNPLGTLPPILETSISSSTSSTCNKINVHNQSSTTTTSASMEPGCLIAIATPNSTRFTNNHSSPHDHKLLDEAL